MKKLTRDEAKQAIAARRAGIFDHPALVKIGPLQINKADDIAFIENNTEPARFIDPGEDQEKRWDAIPHYSLGDVPENLPDENPDLYRVIVAKRAILAGYEDWDGGTAIVDLLADLRHLCDALNIDFADLDRVAYGHYTEERGCYKSEDSAPDPKHCRNPIPPHLVCPKCKKTNAIVNQCGCDPDNLPTNPPKRIYVVTSGGLINSVYATKSLAQIETAAVIILDRDIEQEDNDDDDETVKGYEADSAEFDRALNNLELVNLV